MNLLIQVVLLVVVSIGTAVCQPMWKVECAGLPLFRGRADPIISPGIVSNHVHRVAGASNFGVASASLTPVSVYNTLRASSCNTCSLKTIDQSAYWHPDLFYKWPNGTLSLVPQGGLTVYYEGRTGTGSQANPAFTAFPPGFRMVAGNPFRRSFNASNVPDTAIRFACLSAAGGPETNGFPAPSQNCINGLRMQVYFPSCWDGVNIDSPTHTTHVAYPDRYDGGNCPSTHPYRLIGIFFEAFYSVSPFPTQTYQPFVLACGDNTGYGFHGDFLNGWDQTIMQKALNDASCLASNTNNGNTVTNCAPFAPYVVTPVNGVCTLATPIPLTENFGRVFSIARLPGCQTITGPQATAVTPCSAAPSLSFVPPLNQGFLLKSVSTGFYVNAPALNTNPVLVNVLIPTTNAIFVTIPWSSGSVQGVNIVTATGYGLDFCSTHGNNGAVICDRPSASSASNAWEAFKIIPQASGQIVIMSYSNNNYLTPQSDGSLAPTSSTIGTAQLFLQTSPDGGHV